MYKQLLKTFIGLTICSLSAMEKEGKINQDIFKKIPSESNTIDNIIVQVIELKIQQIKEIRKIAKLHKEQIELLEERIIHQYADTKKKSN